MSLLDQLKNSLEYILQNKYRPIEEDFVAIESKLFRQKIKIINQEFFGLIFNHDYLHIEEVEEIFQYVINNTDLKVDHVSALENSDFTGTPLENDVLFEKAYIYSFSDKVVHTDNLKYNPMLENYFTFNGLVKSFDVFNKMKMALNKNFTTTKLKFYLDNIFIQYATILDTRGLEKFDDVVKDIPSEDMVRFLIDTKAITEGQIARLIPTSIFNQQQLEFDDEYEGFTDIYAGKDYINNLLNSPKLSEIQEIYDKKLKNYKKAASLIYGEGSAIYSLIKNKNVKFKLNQKVAVDGSRQKQTFEMKNDFTSSDNWYQSNNMLKIMSSGTKEIVIEPHSIPKTNIFATKKLFRKFCQEIKNSEEVRGFKIGYGLNMWKEVYSFVNFKDTKILFDIMEKELGREFIQKNIEEYKHIVPVFYYHLKKNGYSILYNMNLVGFLHTFRREGFFGEKEFEILQMLSDDMVMFYFREGFDHEIIYFFTDMDIEKNYTFNKAQYDMNLLYVAFLKYFRSKKFNVNFMSTFKKMVDVFNPFNKEDVSDMVSKSNEIIRIFNVTLEEHDKILKILNNINKIKNLLKG